VQLPGHTDADDTKLTSSTELATSFRRAAAAHGKHEANRPARCALAGLFGLREASSWPRLKHEIYRGLGCATEMSETTCPDDFAKPSLAGLGTERQPDFL